MRRWASTFFRNEIFRPTLIGAFMQQYVEPVTLSFIYILEPILSAVVAFFYLHEFFSPSMYMGEGLVLVGVVLQTTVGLLADHSLSPFPATWYKYLRRQSST